MVFDLTIEAAVIDKNETGIEIVDKNETVIDKNETGKPDKNETEIEIVDKNETVTDKNETTEPDKNETVIEIDDRNDTIRPDYNNTRSNFTDEPRRRFSDMVAVGGALMSTAANIIAHKPNPRQLKQTKQPVKIRVMESRKAIA